MTTQHLTLTALGALLLGGVALPGSLAGAEAQKAPPGPAPGRLEILGKDGKPAGLCPLKHTDVQADVAGFVARVTVKQQFENTAKEPAEAVYTFPLPEDAAVDDMVMTIGQRVVKGQIKRREEARQIYEAAKNEGRAAALLDQERPNIFTQSVANLMPGEQVTITISYVHLLKYEGGTYELTFPMVVGPRYTPGGGYQRPGERGRPSPERRVDGNPGAVSTVTDADKITPPITPPGTRAGHDISVTVKLDAGMPLEEIKSELHEIAVRKEGPEKATIRLRGGREIPNRDFILRYRVAGDRIKTGLLAHTDGKNSGYFTLILQPPSAPPQKDIAPKEMVFVIDQTGSQAGKPIEKAKEAMRFCIENLNPGDTFQILAFNTQVYPCFSAPVPVNVENTQKAIQFIHPLEGRGGTNILKAVDHILQMPTDPARPRIVCYMTDGYVGNDLQIIDYIRKHRREVRFFPFGVGNAVNRFLIEGMASEGRGAPYYVTLTDPPGKAASKFYERVAKPLLLDVSVDWGNLPVEEVYPKAIPDVFTAGPIILKGRYRGGAEGDITVKGLLRGQPWSQKVHVSFPAEEKDNAAIPTLWARQKIEDLQVQDYLGQQTGKPDPKITEQIVALALDYRLMTQHTSFVAVEEKVVNIGGKQRRIDVPVEMPDGVSYSGIFGDRAEFAQSAFFGRSGAFGLTRQSLHRMPTLSGGGVVPKKPGVRDGEAARPDTRLDSEAAQKALAAMKPEERAKLLREVKLSEPLQQALTKPARVLEVQVWLNEKPQDALAKLKAAGFTFAAELKPGKLLLGTLDPAKIDALLALPWVRFVEAPKFK